MLGGPAFPFAFGDATQFNEIVGALERSEGDIRLRGCAFQCRDRTPVVGDELARGDAVVDEEGLARTNVIPDTNGDSRDAPLCERTHARQAGLVWTNHPGGLNGLGNGTLQFGISQGPGSFGSPFSSQLGPGLSSQNSRQEFDRRLAPPTSLEYNGVR